MPKNIRRFIVYCIISCLVFSLVQIPTENLEAKEVMKTSIDTPETYTDDEKKEYSMSVPQYTITKTYGAYNHGDEVEDEFEDDDSDEPDDEGICGEQISWELINGTLYITGTGKMYDYPSTPPWYKYAYRIDRVEVSEGITYIGEAAFYECTFLKKVSLPSTLTEIGVAAFVRCEYLEEVSLPSQLKYIDAYAFQNIGIKEMALPDTLKGIGENAFSYCYELQTIKIPSGITKIKDGVFYECSSLKTISLPSKLKEIGECAFYYCTSLEKISIPKTVKKIGNGAFYGCTALKSVKLPSGLNDIGIYTFSRGTKAKNLPDEVSQMEDGALCKAARVKIKVKEYYKEAFEVLKIVNKERKKKGLKALKMDQELLYSAMFRGAETCLYWSHTRPTGFACSTISELMYGENIAVGQRDAAEVMNDWMHSPGHKANILNKKWKSIGIGCVEINGIKYWVQCFGMEVSHTAKQKNYKDKSRQRTVFVAPGYVSKVSEISVSASSIMRGGTIEVGVNWYNQFVTISIPSSSLEYKSSKQSICKVTKGKIKALRAGKAKVKIWFPGYKKGAVTKKITVV